MPPKWCGGVSSFVWGKVRCVGLTQTRPGTWCWYKEKLKHWENVSIKRKVQWKLVKLWRYDNQLWECYILGFWIRFMDSRRWCLWAAAAEVFSCLWLIGQRWAFEAAQMFSFPGASQDTGFALVICFLLLKCVCSNLLTRNCWRIPNHIRKLMWGLGMKTAWLLCSEYKIYFPKL